MSLLIPSLMVMFFAPLFYFFAMRFNKTWKVIEKTILFVVGTMVVLHILPESISTAGYGAALVACIGLFLPSTLERIWHRNLDQIHTMAIFLTVVGLGLHNFIDGAAVATPEVLSGSTSMLSYAVILHRIPEGILICSLFYPRWGLKWVLAFLAVCLFATTLGYFVGESFLKDGAALTQVAYFQALMSGSLLHVLLDRHDHHH